PRLRGRRLRLPDGQCDGVLPDLHRPRPAAAPHHPRQGGVLIMTTASPAHPAASAPSGTPASAGRPPARRRRGAVGRDRTNWTATVLLMVATLAVLVRLVVTVNMPLKTTGQAVDGNARSEERRVGKERSER